MRPKGVPAVLAWLPAAVLMAAIARSSHGAALPAPWWLQFPHSDKAVHLAIYGLLGGLSMMARRLSGAPARWSPVKTGIAAAALFGLLDEFHQSFIPSRSPQLGDWIADCLGAWVVTLLISRYGDRPPAPFAEPEITDSGL